MMIIYKLLFNTLVPGCLSSWFRAHPDLLQAVLPIILDGLSNASLATSAALAFRDVCAECAEQLAPVVMQIIPSCQVRDVIVLQRKRVCVCVSE